jgi:hypothetical protein
MNRVNYVSVCVPVLWAEESGTNMAAHANIPNFTKRSGNVSNYTKAVRQLEALTELEGTSDGWANSNSLNQVFCWLDSTGTWH